MVFRSSVLSRFVVRAKTPRRRRPLRLVMAVVVAMALFAPLFWMQGDRSEAVAGAAEVPRIDRPVDPEQLSADPMKGWGVTGYQEQTGIVNKSEVWDFAQIGDRLYVAGSFTGVRRNYYGVEVAPPIQSQSFLAAFNVDTNEWIDTFRPTFDAPVLSLAATPDGKLAVGGAFTTVNGAPRRGLAKLDPTTGQVETTFAATVAQDGSAFPALVRELKVDGTWLYVAGDFNRIVLGAERNGVYSVARVGWASGAFDYGWRPRPTGAGVSDVEPDPTRNRVHLAGLFTAVNASPSTAYHAVVSMADGATVTNVAAFVNDSAQFWEFGVALNGNRLWTAGAQHQVQVLDAATRNLVDWYRTGTAGTSFNGDANSYFSGGDMQVIEAIDSFVMAGCHCIRQNYGGIDLERLHYWSGNNQFSGHSFAIAYDATTRRPLNFIPRLTGNYYGTWAIGSDTNGCLYLGGDYHGATNGLVLGGFARFCRLATEPLGLAAAQAGTASVRLSWTAPNYGGSGVSRYRITRDGVFIGETAGLTYVDGGLVQGRSYTYAVAAVTTDGRLSPAASVAASAVADGVAPTTPGNVVLSTNALDRVTITWDASTDNVGVSGYLVHRDFQFLAFVPAGLSYNDTSVLAGSTYRYQVRSQDAGGNVSAPSPTQQIAVRSPDIAPPSVPGNVALTTNGATDVSVAWSASTDNVGVTGYLVHRDFQFLAFVPVGTTYTDTAVVANSSYGYEIRAQDDSGNVSAPSAVARITVTPGGLDLTPPTVPTSVQGSFVALNGVVLTWAASTDNDRVNGYLIHRNGVFLAFVSSPALTYTDVSAPSGQNHSYVLRSQDRSGNNSGSAAPVVVAVP